MEDEDDVLPPLEDMSEVLERNKARKTTPLYEPRSRMRTDHQEETSSSSKTTSSKQKKSEKKEKTESFGGFSKGFLLSGATNQKPSSSKKKKKTRSEKDSKRSVDDIPFLKAQTPKTKAPVIPEVQDAMKEAYSQMDAQGWMSDSILEKIVKHPVLSRALRDPYVANAISKFQEDPELMVRNAEGDPKLQLVLREFCELMGTHFVELGDKYDAERKKSKNLPGPNYVELGDVEEVREALGKKGVKEALADKEIQLLFSYIKTNPAEAKRMSSTARPELREKIQLLIDNRLLAFQ